MMSAREIAPSLLASTTPGPVDFESVPGLTPVPLPTDALVPLSTVEQEGSAGPEEALPTAVLERRSGFTADLRPGGHVGPYALESLLVKAPGATFYTARTLDGTRILLQIARLRAVGNKAERVERLYVERRMATLTRLELAPILAHGGADEADGQRAIFWAMPLPDGALALKTERRRDLENVLRAGRALAHRLVVRHDDRMADPLLTEALVFGHSAETTTILGVSLVAPQEWLSEKMASRRLAPEETVGGAPLTSGDLYRLGQTLAMLAAPLPQVPPMLSVLVTQLSDPRPEGRGSAGDAMAGLDALIDALIPPPMLGVDAAETIALAGEGASSLVTVSPDESGVFEIAFDRSVPSTNFETPKGAPAHDFTAEAAAMALWLVSRPAHAPIPDRLRTAVRTGAVLEERAHAEPKVAKAPAPPPPSAVIARMIAPVTAPVTRPDDQRAFADAISSAPEVWLWARRFVPQKMRVGMALALLVGIALGVLTTRFCG